MEREAILGSPVHWKNREGEGYAAIITFVWPDGSVNLAVFDRLGHRIMMGVKKAEQGDEAGQWNWPSQG
jgi:hypothetical protein